MKKQRIAISILILTLIITLLASSAISAVAAEPTGYTSGADVVYQTHSQNGINIIANWGARDEVCTFLSIKAEAFYQGAGSYDNMSALAGGTSQSDAHTSALYIGLKQLMTSKHSHRTTYNETRDQYKYTDCEKGNTANISSFYSAKQLSGVWDSGATWNREHTWPRSKCINKNKADDSADIMMLRPTATSENSSRGNSAYGVSGGFYEPADSVKGDCARIVLYGYTRWGNTSMMWGSSGVIENLDILLQWMEEDPVDTWEMGRNDSVQSITGTRNVFIDYPEYAWLLFGAEIPEDIQTPSGEAKNDVLGDGVASGTEGSANTEGSETKGDNEQSEGAADGEAPTADGTGAGQTPIEGGETSSNKSGCSSAVGGSTVFISIVTAGAVFAIKRCRKKDELKDE